MVPQDRPNVTPPRQRAERAPATTRLPRPKLTSRERIIDASLSLLVEGGYPALSIAAICKRADVATASLYHHFGDKAGLLAAMIEESANATTRAFVEVLSDHEKPLDQVNAYIAAMRDIGRDRQGNVISVLNALAQAGSDSPETAKAVERARKRAWGVSAAEFSEKFGVADGMLFTHLSFAFASYVDHITQSSDSNEDARAVFKSCARSLIMCVATMRPEFTRDPDFAAALARASQDSTGLAGTADGAQA